jgi:dipeptidyl aminopeptidase/acylaminoacyl peptidase
MKQFFLVAILAASELYAQKAVIQPGDIANLKRVEAPHISPDGRWIAYTVDVPVAAEKHRSAHIWLVPSDHSAAARPFAYSGESESAPDFSPDGTHIAFLSDRPNPLAEPDASPFRFAVAPGAVPKDVAPDPKYAKELAESKAFARSSGRTMASTLLLSGRTPKPRKNANERLPRTTKI